MKIDSKGRCCGRKPLSYKKGGSSSQRPGPFLFCDRCHRSYDPTSLLQIENWAWIFNGDGQWVKRPRHVPVSDTTEIYDVRQ